MRYWFQWSPFSKCSPFSPAPRINVFCCRTSGMTRSIGCRRLPVDFLNWPFGDNHHHRLSLWPADAITTMYSLYVKFKLSGGKSDSPLVNFIKLHKRVQLILYEFPILDPIWWKAVSMFTAWLGYSQSESSVPLFRRVLPSTSTLVRKEFGLCMT